MKCHPETKIPWLLLTVILFVGPREKLSSAEPHPNRITSVIGLLAVSGSPRVAVKVDGARSKWLEQGMEYQGNTIISISLSTNLVSIKGIDGSSYTLPLNASKLVVGKAVSARGVNTMRLPNHPSRDGSAPAETVVYELYPPKGTAVKVDDLDFDWIKSDANPMKNYPSNPSGGEMLKWREMTPEEKNVFIETYRQCGWAVTVHDTNKGVGFEGRKLSPRN